MDVTIVVSPRERFSSIVPSLRSLFASIPDSVRVIVVEGGTPEPIRAQLALLARTRPFDHLALDYMVTPNEARNLGARRVGTTFMVLADNDIEYEPGWLEALLANAERTGADAVAPLIFIGPLPEKTIHHAGGWLVVKPGDGRPLVSEAHRLMDEEFETVRDALPREAPVENDICEFHCMLMRKDFFDRMGGLDERLITGEQVDLGLRAKALGATVTFERDSHVTYRARDPFVTSDLLYHLFRWSDHRAVQSMDAIEDTWNMQVKRHSLRYDWIAQHRARGARSAYPRLARLVGDRVFRRLVIPLLEARATRLEARSRRGRAPDTAVVPVPPPVRDVRALVDFRAGDAA